MEINQRLQKIRKQNPTRLSDQRGMTFQELIVIMIIIAIISLIVAPQIVGAIQSVRLNAAASKLASDIRYTRELALSRHDVFGIEFDQAGNSYIVFSWDGATKTTMTSPYLGGTNLVVDYDTSTEFAGVSINAVTSTEIRIDAFGIPYDATNTALVAPATVVLQNGAGTRTVRVQPETALTEII